MTQLLIQMTLLSLTTLYQAIALWQENQDGTMPGERFDVGGFFLHLYRKGSGPGPTIVLDHSLGGLEGYAIVDDLARLGSVCIYDRAGYGWSDQSPVSRTSHNIVEELDRLLTQAQIQPPYLLVGDSFGTYNMRLYAHRFPEKVVGLVLTDGLHESGMLNMPLALRGLKLLFLSGFGMAILGSGLGIVRVLRRLGVFEQMKPELKGLDPNRLRCITRSFCRPKHWITMSRELWSLDQSGREVSTVQDLQDLPIVNIKSNSFFKPVLWTRLIPLNSINQLRDQIHEQLLQLSSRSRQILAPKSGHFVWIDEPERLSEAVQQILADTNPSANA